MRGGAATLNTAHNLPVLWPADASLSAPNPVEIDLVRRSCNPATPSSRSACPPCRCMPSTCLSVYNGRIPPTCGHLPPSAVAIGAEAARPGVLLDGTHGGCAVRPASASPVQHSGGQLLKNATTTRMCLACKQRAAPLSLPAGACYSSLPTLRLWPQTNISAGITRTRSATLATAAMVAMVLYVHCPRPQVRGGTARWLNA